MNELPLGSPKRCLAQWGGKKKEERTAEEKYPTDVHFLIEDFLMELPINCKMEHV